MLHPDQLYVITAVSNPVRFQSRYDLYSTFEQYVRQSGATLITVEVAFGERPHQVTQANNPCHIQLRSSHELWVKESAINIGISRLPADWKYVAWVDADVRFERPDWALETIQQLQHYDAVQMFSHAIDLGPDHELVQTHTGFAYSYLNKRPFGPAYEFWHPGYAFAMRRSAFEAVGGLLDHCILGAADHHMATALIGAAKQSYPVDMSRGYIDPILRWQERSEAHIKRNLGYVPGLLRHQWHGKKSDRRYVERWDILRRNHFDPSVDIKRDSQMLVALTNRNTQLRDDLRTYFRQRNEDSIDL